MRNWAYVFICIFSLSCSNFQNENNRHEQPNDTLSTLKNKSKSPSAYYNFNIPSATFVLDKKLREISGLTYNSINKEFIAINDEEGHFFILNQKDFSIKSKIKFAKRGDYESVEYVNDEIVICKNSGKLYFYNVASKETVSYKSSLSIRNDVEGLCYIKEEQKLLLACKGRPLTYSKNQKDQKCIYSFDLKKKTLDTVAFLCISDDELMEFATVKYEAVSQTKKRNLIKHLVKDFSPSAIAIQPKTRDYYIASAKGSFIVIMDRNKKFKDIIELDSQSIPQPEGLAFDSNQNLFISTEGHGFSGKVFKFDFKQ